MAMDMMDEARTRQGNVHREELVLRDMLDVVWDAVLCEHTRHIPVQSRDAHVFAALQPGVVRCRQQLGWHSQLHIRLIHSHEQVSLQCTVRLSFTVMQRYVRNNHVKVRAVSTLELSNVPFIEQVGDVKKRCSHKLEIREGTPDKSVSELPLADLQEQCLECRSDS